MMEIDAHTPIEGSTFFDAYPPIRDWLDKHKPDVVINIYNDHGLGFFLDKMPTFAIGAAHEYRNEDEGWGLPKLPPFPGDARFSWHIIESEFDITSCQELAVDHGFTVPMQLFWPKGNHPPAIPISANTVQHPIPTLMRALDFGKTRGKAIRAYPEDIKVVVHKAQDVQPHDMTGAPYLTYRLVG